MLQCVAACCSLLQYVAVCCSMLQCVAVDNYTPRETTQLNPKGVTRNQSFLFSKESYFCKREIYIEIFCIEETRYFHTSPTNKAKELDKGQCATVCCSVLQRVAACCSVLQCVAVRRSALQCVAVCCSVLVCVAVCWNVLECVVLSCSVSQCVQVCCWCFAVCCST